MTKFWEMLIYFVVTLAAVTNVFGENSGWLEEFKMNIEDPNRNEIASVRSKVKWSRTDTDEFSNNSSEKQGCPILPINKSEKQFCQVCSSTTPAKTCQNRTTTCSTTCPPKPPISITFQLIVNNNSSLCLASEKNKSSKCISSKEESWKKLNHEAIKKLLNQDSTKKKSEEDEEELGPITNGFENEKNRILDDEDLRLVFEKTQTSSPLLRLHDLLFERKSDRRYGLKGTGGAVEGIRRDGYGGSIGEVGDESIGSGNEGEGILSYLRRMKTKSHSEITSKKSDDWPKQKLSANDVIYLFKRTLPRAISRLKFH